MGDLKRSQCAKTGKDTNAGDRPIKTRNQRNKTAQTDFSGIPKLKNGAEQVIERRPRCAAATNSVAKCYVATSIGGEGSGKDVLKKRQRKDARSERGNLLLQKPTKKMNFALTKNRKHLSELRSITNPVRANANGRKDRSCLFLGRA